MPEPNLIHPIDITIERRDPTTVMDDDAREPVHGAGRWTTGAPMTISAQVKIEVADEPEPNVGGLTFKQAGYILVRVVDMEAQLGPGGRLQRGDKIIAIGNRTVLDGFITKNIPAAHYPDQSGASLIKYYFECRDPSLLPG